MSELIPSVIKHLANNREIFTPTTPEEVVTVIPSLQAKKSVRENNIRSKFLKFGTLTLSSYISNLFNCCVEQGEFPNALKITEIVLIYKKRGPSLCSSYRLISLLSTFSKILKKLIFIHICYYLEKI